jgi:hypothetical protein
MKIIRGSHNFKKKNFKNTIIFILLFVVENYINKEIRVKKKFLII